MTVAEGIGIPRGVAYISPAALAALGCAADDVVEIVGPRTTVARAHPWPHTQQDVDGLSSGATPDDSTIQMDGLVRQNSGAALGDLVTLHAAQAQPAVSVALVPVGGATALNEAELRHVARSMRGLVVLAGDLVRIPGLGLATREFQVFATNPASAVTLEPGTSLRIQAPGAGAAPRSSQISYEDIGGLGRELQHVRELIELPLKHPELFDRLGIEAPKGVLLYGPPGTGKTMIARAVASESSAHFYSISGPEIIDKFYGESEAHLRRVFTDAQRTAPSVIFLDEIDAIAPKRSEVWGEVEKRVVGQLLSLMDGLRARGQVVVVGATNRPDALDPALRRPGRFDREISLHAPDMQGRIEILRIHSRDMPLAHDVDVDELSRITPGFVGADLAALCRESAMSSLRRTFPTAVLTSGSIPIEQLLALTVTMDDFRDALMSIEPSAAREVSVEVGRTTWDDVGGLVDVKRTLVETIEWPLRYPELYEAMDLDPIRGVLLSGPPGTGKTLLARALATACQANFIAVKGPELLSKWVGESERGVRETFTARQAGRALRPLPRRAGCPRPGARPVVRRRRRPRDRPAPHRAGRHRGAARRGRRRRDEPPGTGGPRRAALRALRPRAGAAAARPRGAAHDLRHPHTKAHTGSQRLARCAGQALRRAERRRHRGHLPSRRESGGQRVDACAWRRRSRRDASRAQAEAGSAARHRDAPLRRRLRLPQPLGLSRLAHFPLVLARK